MDPRGRRGTRHPRGALPRRGGDVPPRPERVPGGSSPEPQREPQPLPVRLAILRTLRRPDRARTGVSETFTLGLFYTVIRPEEKWILAAAEERGIPVERFHDEAVTFPLVRNGFQADLVLNRSVSHSRSLYALRFFEHYGVPTELGLG